MTRAVVWAVTGIDISAYPPMGPELVAPVVGWLAHGCCSITGEMLVSIAGRVAKAYVAESKGIYRGDWDIDRVGEQMSATRDTDNSVIFPVVPDGHKEHILYSFAMATRESAPL
jgi:hypothetical protein